VDNLTNVLYATVSDGLNIIDGRYGKVERTVALS
jgi:hypothetical protein